jgi:hypothetical protein
MRSKTSNPSIENKVGLINNELKIMIVNLLNNIDLQKNIIV